MPEGLHLLLNADEVMAAMRKIGDEPRFDLSEYSFATAVLNTLKRQDSIIYGSGGFNRYYVDGRTGFIRFSRGHASSVDVETMRQCGMEIHG